MSSWKSSPCNACHERPKAPGRGQRWCVQCAPIQTAARLARQKKSLNAHQHRQRVKHVPTPRRQYPVVDGRKTCSGCEQNLPVSKFGPITTPNGKKVNPRCRECVSEWQYAYTLRTQFGLTGDEYMTMFESQGGACFICARAPRKRRLAVDHCHESLLVRGLLCRHCNQMIGHVRDDPVALRRAAEYLETPPAFAVIGQVKVPG